MIFFVITSAYIIAAIIAYLVILPELPNRMPGVNREQAKTFLIKFLFNTGLFVVAIAAAAYVYQDQHANTTNTAGIQYDIRTTNMV